MKIDLKNYTYSSEGIVSYKGKPIHVNIDNKGCFTTSINQRPINIGRLILLIAGFNMKGLNVVYLNLDKFDTRPSNLEPMLPGQARAYKFSRKNTKLAIAANLKVKQMLILKNEQKSELKAKRKAKIIIIAESSIAAHKSLTDQAQKLAAFKAKNATSQISERSREEIQEEITLLQQSLVTT